MQSEHGWRFNQWQWACRYSSEPLLASCSAHERLGSLRSTQAGPPSDLSSLQSLEAGLRLWSWDDLAATR